MRKIWLLIPLLGILVIQQSRTTRLVKATNRPPKNLEYDARYWQALVHIANGEKTAALKTVEAIRNGGPLKITAWKEEQPCSIDDFFNKLFISSVARDPQMLTALGLFESIGIHDHNGLLNDISVQALILDKKKAQENLCQLNKYCLNTLTPDQQLSYHILLWMLTNSVNGEEFLFHEYKINHIDGPLVELTLLLTHYHKLKTSLDAHNYNARLSKITQQLEQAQQLITLQQQQGIVPPRFMLEKLIASITTFLSNPPVKNIFYTHLKEQLTTLQLRDRNELLKQAQHIINNDVYPACRRLQEQLKQLLTVAQTNRGVWALPNGDEYYKYMLKTHTSTNLLPEEIHTLGLQEVAQIHQEMRTILAQEGMDVTNKDVGALMQELLKNKNFYYPNTEQGRQQCLADYAVILKRSTKELGHLFGLKPRANVIIKRVAEHEQEGASEAAYAGPSLDGSRPGILFVNVRNMAEIPRFGMETLLIHEVMPGHHVQVALQNEMAIPVMRKIGDYAAYSEGWALYAEKLAYEHGFYSSSWSKLGHLQDELLRAVRLVVDTGIHYKRWSREHAIAYMQKTTGYHPNIVITQVERYFVYPGQACAYKIGQLKILELRKRMSEALGNKFAIRDFHDLVLGVGAAPLTVLEDVVDQYIAQHTNC